jgi:hypothetical protein
MRPGQERGWERAMGSARKTPTSDTRGNSAGAAAGRSARFRTQHSAGMTTAASPAWSRSAACTTGTRPGLRAACNPQTKRHGMQTHTHHKGTNRLRCLWMHKPEDRHTHNTQHAPKAPRHLLAPARFEVGVWSLPPAKRYPFPCHYRCSCRVRLPQSLLLVVPVPMATSDTPYGTPSCTQIRHTV